MEKLYFFDETFYWGRSGKRATVIEVECEFMQSVRPDELRADFDQIFAAPLPIRQVSPKVVKSGRQKDSAFCTYGISYAGHLDFFDEQSGEAERGDSIAQQVKTVGVSAGSYSYPLWIVACEYKGVIRMRLVQAFKSDRLATAIHQELAALFPGTTYTDRGRHDFDSFPLRSVPHKRNII